MRLLIDTNILIDYLAQREPFFREALLLREAALFGDIELWCSVQSFVDAEYILRHAVGIETLRAAMASCLDFLSIVSPSAEDLSAALASDWPDMEDFLIASCAQRARADYLITRDTAGFTHSKIPVFAPRPFFAMLESRYGITYDEIALESGEKS